MRYAQMSALLQTVCVVSVTCGIIIEICYGAHLGFVLISSGGLAFGISTKINDRIKKSDLKGGENNAN